ncbi:MAG TPA: DUF2808 domain-containing protein [Coleofasciculaceae cyanobacterium]
MQQIGISLAVALATTLLSPWSPVVDSGSFTNVSLAPSPAHVSVTSDRLTATDRTYYFKITLPEHTERFSRLSFTELPQDQVLNPIQFDLVNAKAFTGTSNTGGQAIATKAWIDETGTFWIEFNPAISPGTQLTVAFKGKNPSPGKSHEYGIAAYTATETPTAIFVGNGTLDN